MSFARALPVVAALAACDQRRCPEPPPAPKCAECPKPEAPPAAEKTAGEGIADAGVQFENKFGTIDEFVAWLNANEHKATTGGKLTRITPGGGIEEQTIVIDGKRWPGCAIYDNAVQWAYWDRYLEAVRRNGVKTEGATYFNVKCYHLIF